MPLHKDTILNAVQSALAQQGISTQNGQLSAAIASAIYSVLTSREFERYIKEIVK